MKHCIAIDGGGSKTEAVLFDETGHILRHHVGKGCNASDIGIEEARLRMHACLEPLFGCGPTEFTSLYGGVAGVIPNGDIYSGELSGKHRIGTMRFEDDGCNIISGTLGHSNGCAMICGTGSSLFVRIEGEPLRHIGGKGYLIDTGGSGYELGKDAICMALRAVDGRCRSTILTELLAKVFGRPVSDAVVSMVHRGGRPYIATFASAVFEGRKAGDWACIEIFERGAALMADLTYAAERYFETDFTVVMGGGIISHYPEYAQAIREKASPRTGMILQQAPPIYGAAVEAMWDAGIRITKEVRTQFLTDYDAWTVLP